MEKTHMHGRKIPRELRYLYGMGLESYELEYLLSIKRRNDTQKHWGR